MKLLDHRNIVKLEAILDSKGMAIESSFCIANKKNKYRGSFYLVFEYLKHDLQGLINMKMTFDMAQLKCIML